MADWPDLSCWACSLALGVCACVLLLGQAARIKYSGHGSTRVLDARRRLRIVVFELYLRNAGCVCHVLLPVEVVLSLPFSPFLFLPPSGCILIVVGRSCRSG